MDKNKLILGCVVYTYPGHHHPPDTPKTVRQTILDVKYLRSLLFVVTAISECFKKRGTVHPRFSRYKKKKYYKFIYENVCGADWLIVQRQRVRTAVLFFILLTEGLTIVFQDIVLSCHCQYTVNVHIFT